MPFSNITGGEQNGFLRERLSRAFNMPISIFGQVLPRYRWFGIALATGLLLVVIGILFLMNFLHGRNQDSWAAWVVMGVGAAGAMAWFYMLLRIFRGGLNFIVIFTLILAICSFALEAGLFDSQLIGRLTTRTIWALSIVFAALAVFPLHRYLPRFALPILAGIYVLGALLCVPFIGPMLPFMAFGWLAIPFAGIGFLPYSPLLACIVFGLAAYGTLRHTQSFQEDRVFIWLTRGVMFTAALATFAYAGWFLTEWNDMNRMVDARKNRVEKNTNHLDDGLPAWTTLGARFPEHHAAKMYLRDSGRPRGFSARIFRGRFDPAVYTATVLLNKSKFKPSEREKIYALITGDEHTNLGRLWGGANLKTTRVRTHVQIFPESRVAYTETVMVVHNDSSRIREAIYTLRLPPGSAATQLSLWINGREEPARLALKEKARAAYRQIVGVEARDPALLEWREGSRMRLRVFPIQPGKSRKVKFGIVSPLNREWTSESPILSLPALGIIGPALKNARHEIICDVVSSAAGRLRAMNLDLEEVSVENHMRRYQTKGSYNQDWHLQIDTPREIRGRLIVGKDAYIVEAAETKTAQLYPDDIYLLIDDSLSNQEWVRAYREIIAVKSPRTRVIIAGDTKFSSSNEMEMIEHLRTRKLRRLNIFPFHRLPRGRRALMVTAGNRRSVTVSDLAGSKFHARITKFFAGRTAPVYVATLDGKFSDYLSGLMEFARIRPVAYSRAGLMRVLRTNQIELPDAGSRGFAFSRAGIRIRRVPAASLKVENADAPGLHTVSTTAAQGAIRNDLPARLYMYQEVMHLIGRSHFNSRADKKPALRIARDAMLVSPVSSLVVLESERDYNRFGIRKKKSKLGQSKSLNPALGLVPEPEEWALLILVLMVLLYHRREQITTLLRRLQPMEGRT